MIRRVLFVASEVSPLVKVGGLADVVGALPSALIALGIETRILIPQYSLLPAADPAERQIITFDVPWQGRVVPVHINQRTTPETSIVLYTLDAPEIFGGDTLYYERQGAAGLRLALERYVFFSQAVVLGLPQLGWKPDLLHCHDWHTAAIPALQRATRLATLPTVLTIHNLEVQGAWGADEVLSWLGMAADPPASLGLRDHRGNLNLLQLGIHSADAVNTVSPTYAREILTPRLGAGLAADLRERPGGVSGILNGIDMKVFDPATDVRLPARYDATTAAAGKLLCKRALEHELNLSPVDGPLFGFIGRLTPQKGIDLMTGILPELMAAGANVVILGSGWPVIEHQVQAAGAAFPDHCRVLMKFDAALAQRIYAASDFFLMPSRFEPCGLGQMIAMRYGALPIVRDTGGLHDTVHDLFTTEQGNGLVFTAATVAGLRPAVQSALRAYRLQDMIPAVRTRAMREDFSWNRAGRDYQHLYAQATSQANRP